MSFSGSAPPRSQVFRARVLLFLSGLFFGIAAVLAKVASLAGMDGGQLTFVRFVVGLTVVVSIFVSRPGTLCLTRKPLLITRGFFGGLSALLYFLAIDHISAGEATLLNNTFPIWAVLVSLVVLKERPTLHLLFGLVLASAGVFLVIDGGKAHFGLGAGEAIAALSGLSGGLAVTAIRSLRSTHNAPTIFFAFALGGLVVSLPYMGGHWPVAPAAWGAAFAVGVVSFFAQLFMTEAYGALSVAEAALWQQLTPIASFVLGLFIGERLTVLAILGVILGGAGIVYGSVFGHRPRDPASPEAALAAGLPAEEP